MRKLLAIAVIVLLVQFSPPEQTASACTIGAAAGTVTVDGRPLLWKARVASIDNYVVLVDGDPFDYLGVKHSGNTGVMMGLNAVGVATGNAMVSTPGSHPHSVLQADILELSATVEDARDFIAASYGEPNEPNLVASTNLPLVDAFDAAWMVEVWCEEPINGGQHHLLEYDAAHINRQSHPEPLGDMQHWIIRANEWHMNTNHQDDPNVYSAPWTTYDEGVDVTRALIDPNNPGSNLSAETIMSDFMRLPAIGQSSCSSMVVHGVLPGENPALSTMWVALGNAEYAIAVPMWVQAGYVPYPMAAYPDPNDGSPLAEIADAMNFQGFSVSLIQSRILPVEQHLFSEVADLMVRWRQDFSLAEARMLQVQNHMAWDAYSLVEDLYEDDPNNHAPTVQIVITEVPPSAKGCGPGAGDPDSAMYRLEAIAHDEEGEIARYSWDFGDDSDCGSHDPIVYHRYLDERWYLIWCQVTDGDDVTATDWIYHWHGKPGFAEQPE